MNKTKSIVFIICMVLFLLLGNGCHAPSAPPQEPKQLSICMPEDRPLRIAQLADLHFGDGESMYHNTKEERTKAFMAQVVEEGKPDLIVCSGDQVMSAGVSGTKEFVSLMDSFKTPWVFVWGNHDAESTASGYTKREVSAALAASNSEYLLYAEGYTESGRENRYGNFSITVLDPNGKHPIGAILILDSGSYDYKADAYQTITKGQVAWYKEEIDRLQECYQTENDTCTGVIPTVAFAHMPLPDFSVAYRKALSGEGAEFVIKDDRFFGGTGDLIAPHSPLFEAMAEKGSTKAYFVGHYHISKYQVRMDGILLGFCPQSGFSHAGYDSRRSTYIYSIEEDFSVTTEIFAEKMPSA